MLLIVMGTFVIIVLGIIYLFLYADSKFTYFEAPEGKQEFLVIESNSSKVFQLTEIPFLVEHLETINSYPGFQFFYSGDYKLEWIEPSTLKVYYKYEYDNTEYRGISIEYNDNKK